MVTYLSFARDIQGQNAYAPVFSTMCYQIELTGGATQYLTVPSDVENWIVSFSFQNGTNVWVALNETATIPTGTFESTYSELNPGPRQVNAGDIICFISSNTTAEVGVVFYAKQ